MLHVGCVVGVVGDVSDNRTDELYFGVCDLKVSSGYDTSRHLGIVSSRHLESEYPGI